MPFAPPKLSAESTQNLVALRTRNAYEPDPVVIFQGRRTSVRLACWYRAASRSATRQFDEEHCDWRARSRGLPRKPRRRCIGRFTSWRMSARPSSRLLSAIRQACALAKPPTYSGAKARRPLDAKLEDLSWVAKAKQESYCSTIDLKKGASSA